jgi:branched-chain amino acid transport system ATP-binding protein
MMLEIEKVTKHFGGVTAINNVSIKVEKEQIHGLIGPNGAGKTTLFKMITKVLEPDVGEIDFNGIVITGLRSYQIARLGIGYVFQESLLFGSMTLFENMLVCGNTPVNSGLRSLIPFYQRKEARDLRERVGEVLRLFNLEAKAEFYPRQLSYGDQRRALVARTLINGASLFLLDEPSAGMNAIERDELAKDILEMRKRGHTIFIIEHNLRLIMGICDRISVLNFGKLIYEGTPEEVAKDKGVIEAYIGKQND